MQTATTNNFWQRSKLALKFFFIAFLTLALLIPSYIITQLVNERKERKQEVIAEINKKWSAQQTVTGPFLIVPFTDAAISNGNATARWLYILPDQLAVNSTIEPEIRYRSIYKVPVYTAKPLTFSGSFNAAEFSKAGIDPKLLQWNKARFCMGISDLKGVKQQQVTWNNQHLVADPGIPDTTVSASGITAPVTLDSTFFNSSLLFKVQLNLQGTEKLFCCPLGSTTSVHFNSSWQNPAFDGNYLPDTEHITPSGFEADWNIAQFNRDFPAVFVSSNNITNKIRDSAFGVTLLSPFDAYPQTLRSIKYAILVIALTFFTLFFSEILLRKPIHPLQYILIGVALVIFYILLLSVSEYVVFGQAYAIAAAATILLLGWYTRSLFQQWKSAAVFSTILSALYLFIYVLIQMQDNALLFGSIGLFLLLAAVMYLSRKIDWYKLDKAPQLQTANTNVIQ